jgi:S1/P1 Nuclease
MAVAAVAYQLLNPPIRDRVDNLLTRNPSIDVWRDRVAGAPAAKRKQLMFMLAAVWPDDIRSDRNYTDMNDTVTGSRAGRNIGYRDNLRHKYWHFVDRPFSDDGTALEQPPAVNAEERILLFRQTLGSSESDSVKSYDLVWLEHLVGDVHQPLHCTSRFSAALAHGDRGGNSMKLTPHCTECGGATELHGFWDGVVGESNRSTIAASFAETLGPADAAAASVTDERQHD